MPRKLSSTSKRGKAPPARATWASLMIVDDHPMWRDTLREVLEHAGVGRVVAEASDGEEALAHARDAHLDLVIMDVNLPEMDGITATRALLAQRPDLKVLVLSSSDDRSHVIEAVQSGASGYLLKTSSPDEVAEAARRVHQGELVFPAELSDVVLAEFRRLSVEGPAAAPLRVLIVDEAMITREGLARVLAEASFLVTGQATDVTEMLDLIGEEAPDVVILDARIASARMGSTPVIERLRKGYPDVGILVLSADIETAAAIGLVSEAGHHGIGYLLKDRVSHPDELGDAIRRIARGESVVDPQVVSGLVEKPRGEGPLAHLTPREREVLALMAEGRSNQGIGERLYLGSKAVEAHVRNIFTKLGLEQAKDDSRRVLAVIAYLRSTT